MSFFLNYPRLNKLYQFSITVILLNSYKFLGSKNIKTSKQGFLAQYIQGYFSLKVGSFSGTPCILIKYSEEIFNLHTYSMYTLIHIFSDKTLCISASFDQKLTAKVEGELILCEIT